MGRSRPLEYQLGRVLQTSKQTKNTSGKTHKDRNNVLHSFVRTLKDDFGLKKLENLKFRHVEHQVEKWKSEGLTSGTLQNRVAHLRWLADQYGKNPMIPKSNADLGISKRTVDYNTDKGWTPTKSTMEKLPEAQQHHVNLMRHFGLRFEEAAKFKPEENLNGNRIDIIYGTKGDREREIHLDDKHRGETRSFELIDKQMKIINDLKEYLKQSGVESLSKEYDKYKNFENSTRHHYKLAGMTKAGGGTPHGLRHQYAQDRYKELTEKDSPAQLEKSVRSEIRASMTKDDWKLHKEALIKISNELGHDRPYVTLNYIGKL